MDRHLKLPCPHQMPLKTEWMLLQNSRAFKRKLMNRLQHLE